MLALTDSTLIKRNLIIWKGDRAYFFSNDIFPLDFLEVRVEKTGLQYNLLDSVASTDYAIPPLRVMKLDIEIAKKNKIADFRDPIGKIQLSQDQKEIQIDSGEEAKKLLQLVKAVKELDPDFVVTSGGDSHLFPYLTERATISNVIDKFTLSRDFCLEERENFALKYGNKQALQPVSIVVKSTWQK